MLGNTGGNHTRGRAFSEQWLASTDRTLRVFNQTLRDEFRAGKADVG